MKCRRLTGNASVAHALLLAFALTGCSSSGDDDGGGAGQGADGGAESSLHEGGSSMDAHADSSTEGGRDAAQDGKKDATRPGDGGKPEGGDAGPGDAAADQDASEAATAATFSIDMGKGPARQFPLPAPTTPVPVSPYIYGINASGSSGVLGDVTQRKTTWGLVRMGGNAFTDWNWTTNYLNFGNTGCFSQGEAGGTGALAGAVTQPVDSISAAQGEGAAYLATVPVVDYVSAALANIPTCPVTASDCMDGGTASTTGVNSNGLDFASIDSSSAAFVPNAAHKPGAFCMCSPGPACDGGCSVSTSPVYQDEFVNFIEGVYGSGAAPVFFDLDNEPNYWGFTHPEVWPYTGTLPCQQATVTYDDITSRDTTYAKAVKAAWPGTKVFGPVVAQDGIVFAHSYTDVHLPTEFVDYYLQQLAASSADAGVSLLDVLDVHYYNEGNSSPSQCMQNPRMFWDPNYTDLTPAEFDAIDFQYVNNEFDTNWYPREVIPRLLGKIAAAYASSVAAPLLSFSEYNSGCNTVVAGAIAEADDLGIFGREGVFASALMSGTAPSSNYALAAFDLYRNYDGNGAVVGDTAVEATTSDVALTSVYAFAHSTVGTALDVIAINKSASAVVAGVSIANAPALSAVTLYDIVDGSPSVVAVAGTAPALVCVGGTCSLTYTMPAMSATTLILR
jgi:hypothetical protein